MTEHPNLRVCILHGVEDVDLALHFAYLLSDILLLKPEEVGVSSVAGSLTEIDQDVCFDSAEVVVAFVSITSLKSLEGLWKFEGRGMRRTDRISRTVLVPVRSLDISDLPTTLVKIEKQRLDTVDDVVEFLGVLAGDLGVGQILSISTHGAQIRELMRLTGAKRSRSKPSSPSGARWRIRQRKVIALGAIIVASAGLAIFAVRRSESALVKFTFDDGVQGWTPANQDDACLRVSSSTEKARHGEASLAVDVALDGGNTGKQKAEIWVDLQEPGSGEQGPMPINLSKHEIVAWVYFPGGALGDHQRPNGVQLFAKDILGRGEYAPWQSPVERTWFRITLRIGPDVLPSTYISEGFDATRIAHVGLKFAVGGDSRSKYRGRIYLDSVGW